MNDGSERKRDGSVDDPSCQAGLEQDPSKHSNSPPKEGSNRGQEVATDAQANITDPISGRPPKSLSDHMDDGRPDETLISDTETSDPAQP